MKKEYKMPLFKVERFVANDFVSVCYGFHCNAPVPNGTNGMKYDQGVVVQETSYFYQKRPSIGDTIYNPPGENIDLYHTCGGPAGEYIYSSQPIENIGTGYMIHKEAYDQRHFLGLNFLDLLKDNEWINIKFCTIGNQLHASTDPNPVVETNHS